MWLWKTGFTFLIFLIINPSIACTNIQIKAKDNTLIIGRTLEFGPDLQSRIINSPRQKQFNTTAEDGTPTLKWVSKYGYLLVDFFMTENPVDGMNEKGLSFGYLYLPGFTEYPKIYETNKAMALPYTSFGDWVLGNFASADEVEEALKGISIFAKPMMLGSFNNAVLPVHAVITDKEGKSIVVEFVNGKTVVHKNPLGILTNSPTFDWQQTNLQNYVNLSPYSIDPIHLNGIIYNATGQGSGLVGLPGDPTPPSRFVKMALYQQTALPVADADSALNLTQHILNTVDIPYGTVRGSKSEPLVPNNIDKTRWTVFKDLTHNKFYFTSYNNTNMQSLDLNKIDFSPNSKQFALKVEQQGEIKDAMPDFFNAPIK